MFVRLPERLYATKVAVSWYETKAVMERDGGGFIAHMVLAGVYRAHFNSIDRRSDFPLVRDVIEVIPFNEIISRDTDPGQTPETG